MEDFGESDLIGEDYVDENSAQYANSNTNEYGKGGGVSKNRAASLFHCSFGQVASFKGKADPFNQNTIDGYMCKKDGPMGGSIFITHVNGKKIIDGELIHGTPKLEYPYKDFDSQEYKNLSSLDGICKSYVLANKWNGTNILFFKYHDASGNVYISTKSKGAVFLSDGPFGDFLSLTKTALKDLASNITSLESAVQKLNIEQEVEDKEKGKKGKRNRNKKDLDNYYDEVSTKENKKDYSKKSGSLSINNLPVALKALEREDVQAISFELCGRREPHLVKYDFDLSLKGLFIVHTDGNISAYRNPDTDLGPFDFDANKVVETCQKLQESDFELNQKYRQQHNLPHRYEYNHFIMEGRVLYLLDANEKLIKKTMYKVKPRDIEEVHWSNFDATIQGRVREAMEKIVLRDKPLTEKSLQEELDMGPKEWGRFGRDVTKFVDALKGNVKKIPKLSSDERVVVLVGGYPGSGREKFCDAIGAKSGWTVLNGEEAVKQRLPELLQENSKVVINTDNLTTHQRKLCLDELMTWGFLKIDCVFFDIPKETCQQTVPQGVWSSGQLHEMFETKLYKPREKDYRHFCVIKEENRNQQIQDVLKKYSEDST